MKKIFMFIILLVFCLMPCIADAKANIEYDWNAYNVYFLYEEDDRYYFSNNTFLYDHLRLYTYDKNGNLLNEEPFYDSSIMLEDELYSSKKYNALISYGYNEKVYDSNTDIYYNVDYVNEVFYYYDYENSIDYVVSFSDDLNFTKTLLGNKYNVYLSLKSKSIQFDSLININEYYVSFYKGDEPDYKCTAYILDEKLNVLLSVDFNHAFYYYTIYIKDGIIYVAADNSVIDLYKLDGTKIDSIILEDDNLDYNPDYICGALMPAKLYVNDGELIINYEEYGCNGRVEMDTISDFVNDELYFYSYFLKYSLNFDVEKIYSNKGEFTHDEKVDEDGKKYIELKINPNEGYTVDEIIVTDINGDRIEVIDNKFYMPMNDVKIEIQYKEVGEYVPIPDTFIGKSITLIFIGLILIGLGVYTVNYVKN